MPLSRIAPHPILRRVLAFATLVTLLLPAGIAHAMSLPVSVESLSASADAVVIARVSGRAFRQTPSGSPGRHGAIYTDADLRVEKVLKGSRPSGLRVTTLGGTIGQLTLVADESPTFAPGERVILFLDKNGVIFAGMRGKLSLTGDMIPSLGQSLATVETRVANGARHAANDTWYGAVQNLLDTAPDASAGAQSAPLVSAAATGPTIRAITPSGQPAGRGAASAVTITGSGFGAVSGQVTFYYGGTPAQSTASITSWTDTSIVCQIPTDASSGLVSVTPSGGSASPGFPYAVGFGYLGYKWKSTSMPYRVNPNSPNGSVDELALVQTAAQAWGGWSGFSFAYTGPCSTTTTKNGSGVAVSDGFNDIYWYSGYPVGSTILAQNTYWIIEQPASNFLITESDIAYNSNYSWGDGSGNTFDIATVGTHELGHSIGLNDQYGTADAGKVMMGVSSPGTQQRTPRADDLAGLRALFSGASALSGSVTFNGGSAYTRSRSVAVSASVSNASSMRFFNGAAFGSWRAYGANDTITLSSSADGAYIVRAHYARNADGSGDAIGSSATLVLDSIAPAGSMSVNNGAPTVSGTAVEADSAVTDANPVEMRFSVDGQLTWTAWEPYAATRSLTLPAGDGLKTVYAQYRDGAGNTLALSDTIVLASAVPPPAAPSGLVLSAAAPAPAISLSWTDNSSNETGFVIERSRDGGPFVAVFSPKANATSQLDPLAGFTAAEQWSSVWTYRIKAVGAGGESAYATSAGLKLSGTLSGSVTASGGSALPGATVTLGAMAPVTTGVGGAYTVPSIVPDTYSVVYAKAGYITQTIPGVVITTGGTTTLNVTLVANPGTTYTLTYNHGAGGTITGTTPQTVNSGSSGTPVTAVATTGYDFVNWSDASTANPRTDATVRANLTVSANFASNTANWLPVHRFYNFKKSVHFYTASEDEMLKVKATLSGTYRYEGVAYQVNAANPANSTPLYRFYNFKKSVHFYTASEDEMLKVKATLSGTYRYEGVAYNVSSVDAPGATKVYRFYNFRQAVHFYTASESEKNDVLAKLSGTYRLEGVAFYLAP